MNYGPQFIRKADIFILLDEISSSRISHFLHLIIPTSKLNKLYYTHKEIAIY